MPARKVKGRTPNRRQRTMPEGAEKKFKPDKRMQKLYRKRARDYNSDDDDDDAVKGERFQHSSRPIDFKKNVQEFEGNSSDGGAEENQNEEQEEFSEDEDGGIQPGTMKFSEGIKAFKLAFKKIVRKSGADDDVLGPVLSGHKKLLAEKLAEEEVEKKVKGEAKKLIMEKGHVKPENYLDAHEKFLLGIATKGVVKLFNAVHKAQNARKGLNPARSKDEKVLKKRRKEAFYSELGNQSSSSAGPAAKVGTSISSGDGEAPTWAPLRDNYMLTNPKLKDWDKMQEDTNAVVDFHMSDSDASSDEDED